MAAACRVVARSILAGLLLFVASCATNPSASVRALSEELLASSSATQTLERRCPAQKIVAVLIPSAPKPVSREQLQRLGVTAADQVRYRHVELRCGAQVFSEADNWYVPARLTAEMNRLLETTDTPFGKVVRPLQPYRRTLETDFLHGSRDVLRHRALLFTADDQPLAEVVEVYRQDAVR